VELPPVLRLLRSEIPENTLQPDNIRRLIRDSGFVKEVQTQAEFAIKHTVYSGDQKAQGEELLNIYP
jgi:hypothetical protein